MSHWAAIFSNGQFRRSSSLDAWTHYSHNTSTDNKLDKSCFLYVVWMRLWLLPISISQLQKSNMQNPNPKLYIVTPTHLSIIQSLYSHSSLSSCCIDRKGSWQVCYLFPVWLTRRKYFFRWYFPKTYSLSKLNIPVVLYITEDHCATFRTGTFRIGYI